MAWLGSLQWQAGWLAALLLFIPAIGSSVDRAETAEIEILDERPAAGEQCLVCRQRVDDGTVFVVRYKGRTFHVRADMRESFLEDPETYFRTLQSRSALFDEEAMVGAMGGGAGGFGWLFLGLYVLVGLVFAALCGYLALGRARAPLPWFVGGLLFNVFALAALLSPRGDPSKWPQGVPPGLVKVPVTRSPLPCPHCGQTNHPAARSCTGCGGSLSPTVEGEAARCSG